MEETTEDTEMIMETEEMEVETTEVTEREEIEEEDPESASTAMVLATLPEIVPNVSRRLFS